MKVTLCKPWVKPSGTEVPAGTTIKVTSERAAELVELGYVAGKEPTPKVEDTKVEEPEVEEVKEQEPEAPAPTKRKRQPRKK